MGRTDSGDSAERSWGSSGGDRMEISRHWVWLGLTLGGAGVGAEEERDESRGEFWELGTEWRRQVQLKDAGGESDIPGRGATPSPFGGVPPGGAGSPVSRTLGSLPRVLAASMPLTLRAWRLPL